MCREARQGHANTDRVKNGKGAGLLQRYGGCARYCGAKRSMLVQAPVLHFEALNAAQKGDEKGKETNLASRPVAKWRYFIPCSHHGTPDE